MNSQSDASFTGLNKTKEIDLKEHISVLKRRFWILILITFLTTSIGIIKSTYFTAPLYQSSLRMIIPADPELMNTLRVLMRDTTILQKVVDNLGLDTSPEVLAQQINVWNVEGSQVVNLNVIDTDPKMAAKIANKTATVFKSEVPAMIGFSNVTILNKAKLNPYPINSNHNRTILLAIMIGAVIGIGIIYFIDSLDDSVRSKEEMENVLGLSVIGTISKMNKRNMKKKSLTNPTMEVRGENIGY